MPELPEMENYRRLLSQLIVGKPITHVTVNRSKSINMPDSEFIYRIVNHRLTQIARRAKHLLFQLDTGETLVLHLMLGGWMHLGSDADKPDRNTQVEFEFNRSEKLYFIGLRLGYLHVYTPSELQEALGDLGPEPLSPEFTLQRFQEMVAQKKGVLKSQLVNQQWIAGIGNCYSDEICYDAGVKPIRKISELTEQEIRQLYASIHHVLTNAIRIGGYMEDPLYVGDTLTGTYNHHCLVYDRGGESCFRCGGTIVLDRSVASRKTFYCPDCQR
ncbi:DNA-formamidopyrimidine glycosylase [Paenibacillus hexagrammi]|uniref:DNA-formamidopyrimidine glycosylase n=1 Tax=Paenibacillus hexagrammi TaxID=2908839 RepID=A0ABY3SS74_9BACL|nr:DNA-formamidopyrimidine glycosylase [Paenibacillus sp. YPD9-1]UJF35965.1 DNA-formamidopyrimidine glycosylase [Paenibacillus sp. YPD9-1]